MYNSSTNKQVIYSLNSLSNSLFYLLLDRDINDITITEVCANSDITRKTFYRNCEELIDLINFRIDTEINESIKSVNWQSHEPHNIVTSFYRYWLNKKPFLSILYKRNLFPRFSERFIARLSANQDYLDITKTVFDRLGPEKKEYYNSFIMGGGTQLMEKWTSRDFDLTPEELCEIYLHFR